MTFLVLMNRLAVRRMLVVMNVPLGAVVGMRMAVRVRLTVGMRMAVRVRLTVGMTVICPRLRLEGQHQMLYGKPHLFDHLIEHVIRLVAETSLFNLQTNMAIAEMVGGAR